jgi:hypothetical protein
MPSNDKRIDDANEADDYLTQWATHLDGSAQQRNLKQGQEGHVDGQINMDGEYSVSQYNESGDLSHVIQGAHKKYSDSYTESLAKGHDSYADQRYQKTQNGKMIENAGANHEAHDGDNIEASSQNKKTFATGGNGLHTVEGDQTFITNSGRVDNYGEQGYSIQSGQEVLVTSTEDVAFQVGTNEGHIVNANLSFDALGSAYINSKGQLNLAGLPLVSIAAGGAFQVGGVASAAAAPASIIMTPASIIFKVGVSTITMTAASILINSPTINVISEGPTMILGAPVMIN